MQQNDMVHGASRVTNAGMANQLTLNAAGRIHITQSQGTMTAGIS